MCETLPDDPDLPTGLGSSVRTLLNLKITTLQLAESRAAYKALAAERQAADNEGNMAAREFSFRAAEADALLQSLRRFAAYTLHLAHKNPPPPRTTVGPWA